MVYSWNKRRVLITGAAGFVGRQLGRYLASQGAEVTRCFRGPKARDASEVFTHIGESFVSCDIGDLKTLSRELEERKIDAVFHLAASNENRAAGDSAYSLFETNTRGTYTLLESVRSASTSPRVVLLSSREAESAESHLAKQDMQPYAASKIAAEASAFAYADTFGIQVAIVRTGNVYGPGDLNLSRLIPATILALLSGTKPLIKGRPEMLRDYLYIDDLVAACAKCAERADSLAGEGRIVRVASGTQTSTISVVEMLTGIAARPDLTPTISTSFANERVDSLYAPAREESLLGWRATVGLQEGLRNSYEWYAQLQKRLGRDRLMNLCGHSSAAHLAPWS